MALAKRTIGFVFGEVYLNDDGTFNSVIGYKKVGVWDDVANAWAVPPRIQDGQNYTLAQFKTFVAGLS